MSESTAVRSPGHESGTGAEDPARVAQLLPPHVPADRVEDVREALADFLGTAPAELRPWAQEQAEHAGVPWRPATGWTPRRRRTVRRIAIIALAHVVGLGLFGSACQGADDDGAASAPPAVQSVRTT